MREITYYDVIGIGIGPFNLSLACLLDPVEDLNVLFLDKCAGFNWHTGILLQDAHLQTPFLSDLVTLADPTSPFSFLNYIKEQGRIYSFYIRESFFLMRSEYNQYCQWAVNKLKNLEFNTHVEQINYDTDLECYVIQAYCTQTGRVKQYHTKKLVLGTGTVPYIPRCCETIAPHATHTANYLANKKQLQQKKSITVLGSGQSAAEIFYDLLQDIDVYDYELSWITRSPRFFPLEYSKLTLEMTSPEYVDYFYQLPSNKRKLLIGSQKNLYKGINGSLINDIYDLLYVKRLSYDLRVNLLTNSELIAAKTNAQHNHLALEFYQDEQQVNYQHNTEGLVLATGYSHQLPAFVEGIATRIQWDASGQFAANRNYSIDHTASDIFVQNVGLNTHGFVTPDLGMVCYRNACIIKEITGKEIYPIEQRVAFQQFAAPQNNNSETIEACELTT